MSCNPNRQLFNSDRPDSSNTRMLYAQPDYVTEITLSGSLLATSEVPILVGDPATNVWVPYTLSDGINTQTAITLTKDIPTIILDPGKWYKFDTTAINNTEGVTLTQSWSDSEIASSIAGFLQINATCVPIEIVRYSNTAAPVLYKMGTKERIVNYKSTQIHIDSPCTSDVYPYIHKITGIATKEYNANVESYRLTVLAGSVAVKALQPTITPTVSVPAGVTLEWGVNKPNNRYISGITFTGETEDTVFIVNGEATTSSVAGV